MRAHRLRTGLAVAATALLLAGFIDLVLETPALLLAAALVPALVAALLAARLDRRAHRPIELLLAVFLWGAVVAPVVAALLNRALRDALRAYADDPTRLAAALGAPLIEEGAKAAALVLLALVWRRALGDVRAGIVFGALVGAGFAMTENLTYFAAAALQRGASGLLESVYLRAALGAFLHPTFTACCGAGIGGARRVPGAAGALAVALLGFGAAVVLHGLWNGIGAPWLHTATCAPGAAVVCPLDGRLRYWLLTAPLITTVFLAPGMLALRLALRAEARAALATNRAPDPLSPPRSGSG